MLDHALPMQYRIGKTVLYSREAELDFHFVVGENGSRSYHIICAHLDVSFGK